MASIVRQNVEFNRDEEDARLAADSALQTELDASQAGAGLGADGSYTANGTANYIAAATSLQDADNALDTQIKTVADAVAAIQGDSSLQTELDATQAGAGLDTDGSYIANATADYISGATDLADADDLLDAAVAAVAASLATETANRGTDISNLQGELDTTQTGAGLNTDGTFPAQVGANYINTSTSIIDALGDLDTALDAEETARASADTAIQTEIDATQVGAGLGTDGSYTANGTANYIAAATSLTNADDLLDAQIKAVADDVAALGAGSLTALQTELDATQTGAGLGADGTYTANGSANYIAAATSLKNADDLLDGQVKTNADAIAQEVTDRTSAVSAEETARIAQDDAIEAGAGLEADGSYAADLTTNYITAATSLKDADKKLDAQAKVNADAISAEETARINADTTLTTNLSTETTNRTNADAALQTELDATQTGAGLGTDGTYTADGTSDYITAATSLFNADQLLDDQIKTNSDDIATLQGLVGGSTADIQTELDATQTGAGLGTDGTYTADAGSDFITGATSLANADSLLDDAIKAEETARIAADSGLQTELDATQTGAGLGTDGTYTADGTSDYITTATSLFNADQLLDDQIKANNDRDDAQDIAIAAKVAKAGDTMSGILNMGTNRVSSVADPTSAQDAATKAYVDAVAAGLSWKQPVTDPNLIADVATLPTSVTLGDTYILTAAEGDFAAGDVVQANQTTASATSTTTYWILVQAGATGDLVVGTRFIVGGVTDTAAGGIFTGYDNYEVEYNGGGISTAGNWTLQAPVDSDTIAVTDDESYYFGRQYTYTTDAPAKWVEIGGAGSIGAGTGLAYAGSTLNVNLGAGIVELPTDEVGVDLFVSSGMMLTIDGSSETTDGAAQLSLKLDGTSLTKAAAGVKVSDTLTNAISTNTSDIATETTNRTNADAALQTELDATQTGAGLGTDGTYTANGSANYIAAATSLQNADNLLDGQVKTNADDIATLQGLVGGSTADIQNELDATQAGAGLGTDGTYTADATSDYITAATSLFNADQLLDDQLKIASDLATAAEPDLGVGAADNYVLTTLTDGTRSWAPFNQTQVGRIRQAFTATEGQSVFTVDYDPNVVDVFLNGLKLVNGDDFTASNGTSVTVTPALSAGDLLEVISYEQYIYANTPQYDASNDIYLTNDLWVTGDVHATAYYTDSARVLKENIISSEISALAMVNATEIVEFNYIKDAEKKRRIGFIADDTDPLMSGVNQDSFDTTNVVGVLMKAVQELSAQNEELKARVEALEG